MANPKGRAAAAVFAVVLACGPAACGHDTPTSLPAPEVAGTYFLSWTFQVLRKSDGFQKQFQCTGTMTLVQDGGAAGTASLSGFATVTYGCPPLSSGLSGTVSSTGAIGFTIDGPRPPEGPCPGGRSVRFSGLVSPGDVTFVSARGVATVSCPEYGEHEFTYLLEASK